MKGISIREANKLDIPILLGLLYELGRPRPKVDSDVDAFRRQVSKYITDSDKKILVAINDDIDLVGMVSIVFLPRLNQNTQEMYVPELIVNAKYQNSGIGSKLIDACMEMGRAKKCHRIRLESGNLRTKSHQFYKHLGFLQSAQSFTRDL